MWGGLALGRRGRLLGRSLGLVLFGVVGIVHRVQLALRKVGSHAKKNWGVC